jgi:uncharacterized protein
MILLILLICTEIVTIIVIRQHLKGSSKLIYYITATINSVLSIYLWILYIRVTGFKGNFDDPGHVWMMINLKGAICAVLVPRIILDILHFSGVALRIRKGGYIRSLTNTGFVLYIFFLLLIISGSTVGKFNYRIDEVNVKINGLNSSLEGLTIVQLSDLHMAGFYKNKEFLKEVVKKVNSFNPDIVINSGDFVNYGWREFDMNDTILAGTNAKIGRFAVVGNHDIGTYNPEWNQTERDSNLLRITRLVKASGYSVLNDENILLKIGNVKVAIIGVITKGRHPNMIHGDLDKARKGTDSADFRILLSHDPNHWEKAVRGKTNIELTFAGHTHGMQIGIMTGFFKWSPSQYFYPRWNGLYKSDNQFLYVNRGLGVLAVPFRIWMPPEITVLRLTSG